MAAVTAALQNASLFRDMSGLAQTAAFAQSLQQVTAAGATAAMQQAGDNLLTVMDQHTQRLRIAAALVAQLYGVPASAKGGGAGAPVDRNETVKGGQVGAARQLDAKHGAAAPATAEGEVLRNQAGAQGGELAKKVTDTAAGPVEAPRPAAAAPTRSVGPKQSVPRTLTMRLNVSADFQSVDLFGTVPVKIEAVVKELYGTRLWEQMGTAGQMFAATLKTSESRLFLNVTITYELGWPQPTRVQTNCFTYLQVPEERTLLQAAMTLMSEKKVIPMPSATSMPDDAAVAAAITTAGIHLTQVLAKPVVTPRSGGGFDVEVKQLVTFGVFQQFF